MVSEAALIYVAPLRNLAVSLSTLTLQAALTVGLILLARQFALGPLIEAAAAGAALMGSLAVASMAKARILGGLLDARVSNWRWVLVWAAVPAALVGIGATWLPEWAELAFGVPAILTVYGYIIWRRGLEPEERMLFKRAVPAG